MDKLIHTALTSMRLSIMVIRCSLVIWLTHLCPAFDVISKLPKKYGYWLANHLSRAFTIRDTKNVFSEEQGDGCKLATDVAINGRGYFIIQDGARAPHLSRRGDLRINATTNCQMVPVL